MAPTLSLYQIEVQLQQLIEARDEAEAEGDSQAVAVIDQEIAAYASREVRKVDSIANYIRHCEAQAELASAEAARLKEAAGRWAARAERLEQATLAAMQAHGVRVLESATNRLTVAKNGGVEPLETNLASLPPEFCFVNGKIPLPLIHDFLDYLAGRNEDRQKLLAGLSSGARPDDSAIRKALAERVPCPECSAVGTLDRPKTSGDTVRACEKCNGVGTVPREVPGARLLPRGVHLRIK